MVAEALIEMEAAEKIGAGKYERTSSRVTYRNGSRPRPWITRVGEVTLRIPKLRQGSFFPNLLEPRRMAEKAIVSVIQEAYIHGVSTRKVDELVRAMGLDGVDKSAVSRLCSDLDEVVNRFRTRALEEHTVACTQRVADVPAKVEQHRLAPHIRGGQVTPTPTTSTPTASNSPLPRASTTL